LGAFAPAEPSRARLDGWLATWLRRYGPRGRAPPPA